MSLRNFVILASVLAISACQGPWPRSAGALDTTMASFYEAPQGIACGRGRYDPNGMTVAHRTLPCGTRLKVTHLRTGKSVTVTVNDRGPFVRGRDLDLSRGAAQAIGLTRLEGVARVSWERVE